MSETPILTAQTRTEFGKGAARRARRAGLIPAAIYGAKQETLHVDLPGHELTLAVRDFRNEVMEIKLDGTSYKVKVQEAQRHPVSRVLLHVDFVIA
ncbi:50S ribosomal protein L25, partial [Schaalia suimastitidis]|uniref:50S ribosomal protein L25 n=1 Tax=Schaalia suimastitidis TaxID=121163 RepID=UPI00041337C4